MTVASREPIVAVATPPGMGGVGIVRLSGTGVIALAETLFSRPLLARVLTYGVINGVDGQPIDQAMAVCFPMPRSFTGEDVVEFQGHGGPVVLGAIVAACQALGARPARPGEFSERAFLNGKIDLAQAEAIADLISSGSMAAARGALRSLSGAFSTRVEALAEELIWLRTYVEATLDFPDEEDVDRSAEGTLTERLDGLARGLQSLQASSSQGVLLTEGIQVVLAGAPNVGKSSLLNALAGEDRAIVATLPGTTRDVLEADLSIDGLPIRLIDTAGLRSSADPVEREGVRRAQARVAAADLVIEVRDFARSNVARESFVDDQTERLVSRQFARSAAEAAHLLVWNKIDQVPGTKPGWTAALAGGSGVVRVSALTGSGLDSLRAAIAGAVGYSAEAAPFSARRRHLDALSATHAAIVRARSMLTAADGGVLLAEELRDAHEQLAQIIGRMTPDELLGQIFGSFCIGK